MLSNMFWLKTVLFETSDSFCGMARTILVRPKPLGRPPIISPGCLRLESSIRFPIRFPMIFLFLDLDQASSCGFSWQSGSHKRDQKVWLQPFNPWSLRCAESKAWFLVFMEPQKAIPQFWMTSFEKWLHQETWRNTTAKCCRNRSWSWH